MVFADTRSRLHDNRSLLPVPGVFGERHMPIHLLRINEMTVGRFSTSGGLNLNLYEVSGNRHRDAFVGLNLTHLLGSPLSQRSSCDRIWQRLQGLPSNLVIALGY